MSPAYARAALLALLAIAGCATFSDQVVIMDQAVHRDAPLEALAALEKQHTPPRDEVLFLMNKALLLRMAGNFAASNAEFETAKKRIEHLEAISVSEKTGTLIINDATRAYIGAPYERALIHIYSALNYLALNDINDARVEILQLDVLLKRLSAQYPKLADFAFARLLSGLIYDELGERSNALIAYRHAFEDYSDAQPPSPPPPFLGPRLVQLTRALGLSDEVKRYQREFGDSPELGADVGEAVVILHAGVVPPRREHSATIVNPANGRLIRISQPYYPPRNIPSTAFKLTANDITVPLAPAANVAHLAEESLSIEMPQITARAIARIVAKDVTARQAKNQNEFLGAAINIANVLTERADTRSWTTLPLQVYVAVLPLKAGRYPLRIESDGRTREFPIEIRAGHKTFVSPHWAAG